MVANAQGDVRQEAAKPEVAEEKAARAEVVVDDRQVTEDQVAAAAAATDADQSAAVEVAAEAGILPTDAPIQSIGEYAQAPAPATTTTTPTPAPAAEESTMQYNPWVVGGAAVLGIGAIAAVANDDDDNNSPPVAEEPPAAPPPAEEPPPPPPPPPAENTPPTSADGQVALDPSGTTAIAPTAFAFTDADAGDALSKVKIGTITMFDAAGANVLFDPITGHGYELVTAAVTWEAARDAAAAKGGYLAILDTPAEMQMINDSLSLGGASGTEGTWVGAQQAADQATPGAGWTWLNGTPLDASPTSPLWNNQGGAAEPNDVNGTETNAENFAAIYEGTGTNLLYDAGPDGGTGTQQFYLVEYDGALRTSTGAVVAPGQEIAAADLAGGLTWNSVFNAGGTVTFAVADSQGVYSAPENTLTIGTPPVATSLASLVEDQHLTSLA